tara:strand:- start:373 stop:531 length:159 start_codon:yes stop_codon:yes gene_type:complete
MSTTWIILIIVLVVGVVASNILLLKYSAKTKWPEIDPRNKGVGPKDDEAPKE